MGREGQHPSQPKGRRRLRRGVLIAAALIGISLLAGGCSSGSTGPGVAGQGSSTNANASPSVDRSEALLGFSQCMRDQGISDFPDPDAEGHLPIHGEPAGDVDPESPQFNSAYEACRSLLPQLSEEEQQQAYEEMLAFAKCMRKHGFPNYPDPIPGEKSGPDQTQHPEFDPDNPQLQAANAACGGALQIHSH